MYLTIEKCEICGKTIKKTEKNLKINLQEGKGLFVKSEAVAYIHLRCIDEAEHLGYSKGEAAKVLENILDSDSL